MTSPASRGLASLGMNVVNAPLKVNEVLTGTLAFLQQVEEGFV